MQLHRKILLLLAFVGGFIVIIFSLILMICINIGKFIISILQIHDKKRDDSIDSKAFQYRNKTKNSSNKQRPIVNTIEAEVISAESKLID